MNHIDFAYNLGKAITFAKTAAEDQEVAKSIDNKNQIDVILGLAKTGAGPLVLQSFYDGFEIK